MQNVKTFFFLTSLLAVGLMLWRAVVGAEARRWLDARFGLVILLPGIGMLVPSVWIYYGLVVAIMLFLPRSRVEAVGLFILIALTLPTTSTTLMAGSTYLLKIDPLRLSGLALLAALRFPGGVPNGSARRGGAFDVLFGIFFALQVAIGVRSGEVGVTLVLRTILENVLPYGIPFFLLTRSIWGPTDQRRLVLYFIMAGFLLSVVATFEMLRHWPLYSAIDTHFGLSNGLSKSLAIRAGMLRAPGPFAESTTFGVLLALTTTATAALRSIFRSAAAHQVAILVGVAGSVATLARNGWVGLALGLVLLGLYRGRVARTAGLVVVTVAAFAVLSVALPKSSAFGAATGQSGHAAVTSDYRERLLSLSIPMFKSSPWIGTSSEKLGERLRDELRSRKLDVDFVNSYLYFALVSGGLGLVVFLLFIWVPIFRLWTVRSWATRSGPSGEALCAVSACLMAFSVMIFFTSYYERVPLFAVILFGLSRNVFVTAGTSAALKRQPDRPTLVMAV